MEEMSFWASPALTTVVAVVGSILCVLVGAWVQGSHGRGMERDRFRHEVAARTAEERLRVHIQLAEKVSDAYRSTVNDSPEKQAKLNEAKNYYYDHRFFFSNTLGTAFFSVDESLAVLAMNRDRLHANLNTFFNVIRNDLLLHDLAESVSRAVPKRVSKAPVPIKPAS